MTLDGGRRPGALVISLDFELHWGVRDRPLARERYGRNLLAAREVIPRLLDLFGEFGIAATWGVVGFLFARSRDELQAYWPDVRPTYLNRNLDPYAQAVGLDERDDPFHFAPTLLDQIGSTPGQELATHTFSHFYCCEHGQNIEQFRADIAAACQIARARNVRFSSIIFPRNQRHPGYDSVLGEFGIRTFRGNPHAWMHRHGPRATDTVAKRVARLADHYVPLSGHNLVAWDRLEATNGLLNVPASFFLKPASDKVHWERARFRRIKSSIRLAAASDQLIHLWWHPHNFGAAPRRNLESLRRLLEVFRQCQLEHGMHSLSMRDVDLSFRGSAIR